MEPPSNPFKTFDIPQSKACIAKDGDFPCPKSIHFEKLYKQLNQLERMGREKSNEITRETLREVLKDCLCGPHQDRLDELVPVYLAKI
jgi:hypothetical protein